MPQQCDAHRFLRPPDPVTGDTDGLTVAQGAVEFKEVTHVLADGNHPDVRLFEHLHAVLHHRGLLAEVHKGVQPLILRHQRIARNLVVSHVRAQLYETLRLSCQPFEVLVALDVDVEPLSGIHREFVDDGLCEHPVLQVSLTERRDDTQSEPLPEIPIDELETWTEKTGRYHKHVCEDIDASDIYSPQQSYQPTRKKILDL